MQGMSACAVVRGDAPVGRSEAGRIRELLLSPAELAWIGSLSGKVGGACVEP